MKETEAELLPDELLWADGGHASDVVLTALADGQAEIVPRAVRAHVESCRACTTHLGNAVLLSLHTGGEIAMLRASEAESPSRLPIPRLAIVLGLLVAAIGALPSLLDPSRDSRVFVRELPVLLSGLRTLGHGLLEPGSSTSLVLTYGVSAMLVVFGLVLVRVLPKKEMSR
jgi:hypothetical protein